MGARFVSGRAAHDVRLGLGRLPLRLRWTLAGGLVCALVALGFFLAFSAHLEAQAWRELRVRTQEVARLVELSVEPALERGDAADGQRRVDALATVPEALFGVLSREDGTRLAAWRPERVPLAAWGDVGAGEAVPGTVLARRVVHTPAGARGTLLVGLSTAVMERDLQHMRGLAGLGSLLLWGLGVLALFAMGGPLMRPLERITGAIERLSEKAPVPGESTEEPGRGEPERLAVALSRLEVGAREQVDVLDALVGEARDHQERLYLQQGLLDARMGELRLLRDQLVVADRRTSVGTLSAGVAHEINNPLAYITANIQFALQEVRRLEEEVRPVWPEGDADWAEVLNALSEASDGCTRVQHIVQSLKSFACGDDGRQQSVDLASALKTAINMASNEIRHRARLVVDPQTVTRVEANEVRLAQIFLNLLINAAHAIQPGEVESNEIRVSARQGPDGAVRVSITDTGSGMTPEVRDRLFTPFFTTKPLGVGTGLGLSVCQGLVQGMGGQIEVHSESGRGSTFTVVLPAARTPVRDVAAGRLASPKPQRARLLVVDDEPRVGIALRRALSREHEVTVASGAREALARIVQGEPFDAILCDLMMPEMNGMEFFQELERTHSAQARSVLFLTGGAFTDETRAFLEAHPERLLRKPMDMDALRERLRQMIDAQRLAGSIPEAESSREDSAGVDLHV